MIDASHIHDPNILTNHSTGTEFAFRETKRNIDFNHTTHIREQQIFHGVPVWGANIIVHVPQNGKNITANGTFYQNLQSDLKSTSTRIFQSEQAKLALRHCENIFEEMNGAFQSVTEQQQELIIFIDENQHAHYAFHARLSIIKKNQLPSLPNYIIDAESFAVYKAWNELKTFDRVLGGGYGGNARTGKLFYDGGACHLPALSIERDAQRQMCYLQNEYAIVKQYRSANETPLVQFQCVNMDPNHQNIYWDEIGDAANDGFSPNHDALFAATKTAAMYQDWYHVPVLAKDGNATRATMITHVLHLIESDSDNTDYAYYDGAQQAVLFGDGLVKFYPLPSLDVGAHELSHGFTEQHAALVYDEQPGGINEAFSDMAAKAVEYYTFGSNRWDVGSSIYKANGKALRYMDQPSKDCANEEGTNIKDNVFLCSIDDMDAYQPYLEVHQISGIFNRAFYLIATSPGWNTKKAFDIMLKANMDYWISDSTFQQAACGVIKAARDYGYDERDVAHAFGVVKVEVRGC